MVEPMSQAFERILQERGDNKSGMMDTSKPFHPAPSMKTGMGAPY